MSLAPFRLIRDVAHLRSVSKAARLHGISQSAASQQIQERERELQTTLFDRSTRPLGVTTAGKLYVDFCREILRRDDELRASLARLQHQMNGTVRLAAIYSVGLSEMTAIEASFAQRLPQAELQVSYLRPERVYAAVAGDEADIGLVSYAESNREVIALPWRKEVMVVAVAPSHRLAAAKSVAIAELAGEDYVGFDQDLPIQSHIERFFREHKVAVHTVLRFDNMQMIKEAVAHAAGISIMPYRVLGEDLEHRRIVALRLRGIRLFRPVGIIHRRRKVFNQAGAGLMALLQENEHTPGPS